jgi:hypothetical protein
LLNWCLGWFEERFLKRPIRDGLFLVWRHQRLVWWIFFVNLVVGFLASLAPSTVLHPLLDKSLYSEEMSKRFDATVFVELLSKPEVSTAPWMAGSLAAGLIFLFYMLFVSGGIIATYHQDRKRSGGQFFESCGDFFWRMVRLLLWSIIPFAIVFGLAAVVQRVSGKMASDAPREMQGFFVQVGGSFLCLLLALFVRAWFDLAQARTVIDGVRGMRILTFRSFVLALRNSPRLVSIYLTITIVAGIGVFAAWSLWLRIPHGSFGGCWLLLELLTLVLVGIRLWQRAATVVWYENYAKVHTAPLPLPVVPPAPATTELVEAVASPGAPGL